MEALESTFVDPALIPVRNAWHMLLYAWDLARWEDRWRSAAESAPSLLGLLARVLVDSTDELLRRQLARAHQIVVCEIPGIRGRIDFTSSLRGMTFDSGRAVCAFPELNVDTLRNRIIKGTLARLLNDERVGAGAKANGAATLRHDIAGCIGRMSVVSTIRVTAADLSVIRLGRNDEAYQLPMAICELVHGCEMPAEEHGDRALAALVRDDIKFSTLFERFIRNFLKHSLPDARVSSEILAWPDDLDSPFVPQMRTDVTVEWASGRRMVIDAKYYGKTMATRYGDVLKFHSAHLYQLYAYLRTQEHRGEAFGCASGMLIYPTTTVSIRERLRVQGHDIEVATLDLSGRWQEIEAALIGIALGRRIAAPCAGTPQLPA